MLERVPGWPRSGLRPSALRWPSATTLAWALPAVVFLLVRSTPDATIERAIAVALAVGVLVIVSRHAGQALLVLIAALPFQVVILSLLYRLGVPQTVVRPLSSWRDLIILGIAFAGYRDFVHRGRRLDTLDRLALGYIALVTAYLLLPDLFVRGASNTFAGAPKALDVRLLAFRIDIGFVLLFLGARHSTSVSRVRDRVLPVLLASGTVIAAVAVFEFSFSSAWNTFAIDTLRVNYYITEVLDQVPRDFFDVRNYVVIAGNKLTRPGSTLFDPLHTGFALVPALACGLEAVTRNRGRWTYLATSVIAVALLMVNVRSAVIGAVVVGFLAVRPRPGRTGANRVRVATLMALAGLLLAPVAASSGFAERASNATQASDDSTGAHIDGFSNGIRALGDDPMGRGLGTQPGIGDRFRVQTKVTSENAYLQVGTELGIPTMLLFLTLVGFLLRRLRWAAVTAWRLPQPSAARAAMWGLAIGGLFLHVWIYFAPSLAAWAMAGMAVRAGEDAERTPSEPGPPSAEPVGGLSRPV